MDHEQKYYKYKAKYMALRSKQFGGGDKKFSCKENLKGIEKINDICITNPKGRYNTLEECAFSAECSSKWKSDNIAPEQLPEQISAIGDYDTSEPVLKLESYRTNISKEDILYKDQDVCILNPKVKKGIIIYTMVSDTFEGVCTKGIKCGEQLQKEGISCGRSIYHPYIFFRAPFFSDGADYSTPENEAYSSYGKFNKQKIAFIRVDPLQTYVYSSEIRIHISHDRPSYKNELNNSRKSLSKYLKIIAQNKEKAIKLPPGHMPVYNLYTSELSFSVPYSINFTPLFPLDAIPIERNSEILVRMPHIPKEYFVLCHD